MARAIRTIQDVVAWRMCMGCGACYAVCEKGGVELVDVESEGVRPVFKNEACAACAGCLDVCPGWQVDGDLCMDGRRKASEADHEFGQTLGIWEGYAADPDLRRRASSGGVLSALSLYCLERGEADCVLHAGMDPARPWRNLAVRSRTRPEIFARCGSRYSPASPCEGLAQIRDSREKAVFIGKPCDAAGAVLTARRDPRVADRLALILAFFCAGTPSSRGTLDLLREAGARREDVTSLRYRGNGWPGGFRVALRGREKETFLPYETAWRKLTRYVGWRCRLCPDGLGRAADIACGDAWESYRPGGDDPGRSIVLARTRRGLEIVHKALAAGYVCLEPIPAQRVFEAQKNLLLRRRQLFGRLLAMRLFLVPIPRFRNFSLWRGWAALPLRAKLRSILGTVRRIATRRFYRRAAHRI